MRTLILTLVAFATSFSWAQQTPRLFPVLECPAVGDEFEKMISRLESIKTSIREGANCTAVLEGVKSLEDLLVTDRKTVLEIVDGSEQAALSTEQAKQVRDYAENVTKKVAALSDLFMNSNHCFTEDSKDKRLSSLAGFVSEASNLVGSLTGPWGAPIALAGNVIAGFMTGLDQIFKSRAGYEFDKPEQWMAYVQNLCTYHSYREQIEHLLNPQARVSQLKGLHATLTQQIQVMSESCVECRDIQMQYDSQKGLGEIAVTAAVDPSVRAADTRFGKPLGTYMLQSLGLRDWVNTEIARVQKESESYWGDVSGRHLLYTAKQSLEDFLLVREAPRFLQHQAQVSFRDYDEFTFFAHDVGRGVYDSFERLSPKTIPAKTDGRDWNDPIPYFRALVLNVLDFTALPAGEATDDARYSWLYYRDQSLLRLRTAQTSTQTLLSFCSFFKNAGQFSPAIREKCSNDSVRELVRNENSIEAEVVASPALMDGQKPMTINSELEGNVTYASDKVDALVREIESRELK